MPWILRLVPWASCQMRKIAGCACAGNAGNVFPASVLWCMPGSLTGGVPWSQCRGKRSQHSRRMHNLQSYVSGKRPMERWVRGMWTGWGRGKELFRSLFSTFFRINCLQIKFYIHVNIWYLLTPVQWIFLQMTFAFHFDNFHYCQSLKFVQNGDIFDSFWQFPVQPMMKVSLK